MRDGIRSFRVTLSCRMHCWTLLASVVQRFLLRVMWSSLLPVWLVWGKVLSFSPYSTTLLLSTKQTHTDRKTDRTKKGYVRLTIHISHFFHSYGSLLLLQLELVTAMSISNLKPEARIKSFSIASLCSN